MRIVITGATGFIGQALCKRLVDLRHEVVALSRSTEHGKKIFGGDVTVAEWDGVTAGEWKKYVDGAGAVVNLAGENIAAGRWTNEKKRAILESRLDAGKAVLKAIRDSKNKPEALIQASAVGFYGSRGEEKITEGAKAGEGFLADVCVKWEKSTEQASEWGIRRVVIRSGVVLGRGGMLPRLLAPFSFFMGGWPGSGRQWFSWIHVEDEVSAICFLLDNKNLSGVFNLASPSPVRIKEFTRLIGNKLDKPSWLGVPAPLIKVIGGELAEELVLSSLRVYPERLQEAGFKFKFPDAREALGDLL